MKAAFLRRAGEMYLDDIAIPRCTEDSVLVKLMEIGICGSDLHYYQDGRIGDHIVVEPHILGHEASGIVVETGSKVSGLTKGDRVCVEPGVPCMSCEHCREGQYNLCTEIRFSGAPPFQGMFREYLVHDPGFIHKLPDSVSLTQGALVEPLAVAHNAVKKAAIRPGETVLITGAGPIGLSCLEMARVAGAAVVIVSEPKAHRRNAAMSLCADLSINPLETILVETVREFTKGRMVDCAIEASGNEYAIGDAIRCIRKGGRVVYVGMGNEEQKIPHAEILRKEAVISGIYRYVNDFKPVIELLAAGKLNGETWVSHRFSLDDIVEAIGLAKDSSAETLKIVVHT